MRAWLALRAAQCDFHEEIIDIRRPQRFEGLARIGEFSPSGSVPVLVVYGIAVFDSLAIMEFANDLAEGKLLPADMLARAYGWTEQEVMHLSPTRRAAYLQLSGAS